MILAHQGLRASVIGRGRRLTQIVAWPPTSCCADWLKCYHVTFVIVDWWTCRRSTVRHCSNARTFTWPYIIDARSREYASLQVSSSFILHYLNRHRHRSSVQVEIYAFRPTGCTTAAVIVILLRTIYNDYMIIMFSRLLSFEQHVLHGLPSSCRKRSWL